MNNKNNKLQIRNSTAEFLTFAYQSKGDGVEVRVQNGTTLMLLLPSRIAHNQSVFCKSSKQNALRDTQTHGCRLFESDFDKVMKMMENNKI